MKTDMSGGVSTDARIDRKLEDRLAGRFAAELAGAERDYPALREKLAAGESAVPGRRGLWPRIALPVTTVAVLTVAVLVASGLLLGPAAGPAVGPGPASSSGVVMGADGIPTQIDGQRVYLVTERTKWQNLSGSFLLYGYLAVPEPFCDNIINAPTQAPAEAQLLGTCGSLALISGPTVAARDSAGFVALAWKAPADVFRWFGGPAVVVRVHTHDPDAAGCTAPQAAACEAAIVVEAVVWPVIPTQIAGERVYRAADAASFPKSGSFLLGGPFTKPNFVATCPAQPGLSTAEQQLITTCNFLAIDGLDVAPESNIDEPNNEIVVARVHIGDAEAALCPVTMQVQCKAAIVVEAVVWRGAAPAPISPATPGVAPSLLQAESGSAGPVVSAASTARLGPDGVPTTLNGQPVYRAASLPTAPTWMLGGTLTRDSTCAAPATPLAKPPGCGYWMIDGVKVGTMVDIPESLLDQPVVVQIDRSRSLAVCPGGSCTSTTLVIAAIVWPVPPLALSTPPAAT